MTKASASVTHTVRDTHTAIALGSGNMPVLATPMVIAWCEQAAVAALEVTGTAIDSVGVHIDVRHRAACAVGTLVTATATVIDRDETTVTFAVSASDDDRLLADGTIVRAIVDRDRFLRRFM